MFVNISIKIILISLLADVFYYMVVHIICDITVSIKDNVYSIVRSGFCLDIAQTRIHRRVYILYITL